jgi:hypothetical protein
MSNISSDYLAGIAGSMLQLSLPKSIERERKIFASLIEDKKYIKLLHKCRKLIDDGMESTDEYIKAKQALSDYCDKAFANYSD